MINEKIHPTMKKLHVTWGDARVFGKDADVRRGMNDAEVLERFSSVWAKTLESAVREAPVISLEEANELLQDRYSGYVKEGFQFRQLSIDSAVFVARLNEGAGKDGTCDQLWSIGAHRDPTRLCVHFATVAEKESFDRLAKQLSWNPHALALSLLVDFMSKFRGENAK